MDIREYYDPRSDLNEAPDRRPGLPSAPATVCIAVGRRPGLPVAEVAFPGPFLVELRHLHAAVRGLR
ncbi:MAG: transglutaminase family protein [Armatimonadota bacterium]|nr:transglutaminase family protein [Armatimonadota bacterium]MDR7448210.1 transglutaminase family protein [Armatimonadota bacterium]MDR7458859.1 transglutaminase family protein [Armatimonadota bacterium]MDR7479145.1 transglutaminase family protein [Armatimonadota bacterium]MDR7487643.1 transglutaminase family protein [Armatimonadota bacterium]